MIAGEIPRSVSVLILGGGPGGYTAAARLAELGAEVVLVEQEAVGGTCLHVGCIPSKALISLAHDLGAARRRSGQGLVGELSVDLAAGRRWTEGVIGQLQHGVEALLGKVEVVQGTGRLLGNRRVAVERADEVRHFRYQNLVIATGSRPRRVAALPADGVRVIDSTAALALEEVPASLVVVGGGYIGMELGMAFAGLGSTVTVVEALGEVLAGFDRPLVAPVLRRAEALGMRVLTGTTAVALTGQGLRVVGPAGEEEVPAAKVLVAVGRTPNTDDLQLSDAGLAVRDDGLIEVDDAGRTAVPGIWAIGDVTPGPALAHRAAAQGRVVAEAIAGMPSAFDSLVPLIAFTDPEVASIGLTAKEAAAQGRSVVEGRAAFAHNGRALTLGQDEGMVTVVAEADTGVIVGVHFVGPGVSDLVSEGAVLVETAARLDDVLGTVHPHPTLGETVADAAVAAARRIERRARR